MFEDQTAELLPARTTMRVRGGNARGGDALAVSAAVIAVEGNANGSLVTAISDTATATGGNATGGDANG